ncbi:MAG: recombinase family protein [Bdellovibrio sp.]|nr:recombinase family protein [Bdellovibrio sp.]
MKNKRVALYFRCSTVQQNLEIQTSDLRKYAEARGFDIVKEYSDFGVSGAKDRRPGLDELMKDARKRRFDLVLVWRLDRLGRNTRHLLTLFEELEGLQISLVSHQEAIDLSSSLGRVIATIMSALAAFERDLIKERVAAGIQRAKDSGKKLGRPQSIDRTAIISARERGLTYAEIQKELKISAGSVAQALRQR